MPLMRGLCAHGTPRRYDDAVERAVVDIGLGLAGRDISGDDDDDEGSGGWGDWVVFSIFAGALCAFGWVAAVSDGKKRRRYQVGGGASACTAVPPGCHARSACGRAHAGARCRLDACLHARIRFLKAGCASTGPLLQ